MIDKTTTAEAVAAAPLYVPGNGEVVLITDRDTIRVGDGITPISSLPDWHQSQRVLDGVLRLAGGSLDTISDPDLGNIVRRYIRGAAEMMENKSVNHSGIDVVIIAEAYVWDDTDPEIDPEYAGRVVLGTFGEQQLAEQQETSITTSEGNQS